MDEIDYSKYTKKLSENQVKEVIKLAVPDMFEENSILLLIMYLTFCAIIFFVQFTIHQFPFYLFLGVLIYGFYSIIGKQLWHQYNQRHVLVSDTYILGQVQTKIKAKLRNQYYVFVTFPESGSQKEVKVDCSKKCFNMIEENDTIHICQVNGLAKAFKLD